MSNIMCTVTSLGLLMVKLLFKSPSGLKYTLYNLMSSFPGHIMIRI